MQSRGVVLFDLDGTISDSGDGIIKGLEHGLAEVGRRMPPDHDWGRYLGPPLREALAEFNGLSAEEVDTAVEAYVEYYQDGGMFECDVYAGMPELLAELRRRGVTLGVATSKRAFMAEGILDHFGLLDCFTAVGGAHPDGTGGHKHEVIARTLEELSVDVQDLRQVVMVGDRDHDIRGAKLAGLRAVGVRWGYAEEGELEAAGADHVVDTVEELRELLLPASHGTA